MRKNWLRTMTRRKITVVLTTDQHETLTIHGHLWEVMKDGLLLRSAEVETPDGRAAMGGEVFIPRPRVLFCQSLEAQP